MKLFPWKKYEVKLVKENPDIWNKLKNETQISNSLVTVITKKAFIGKVGNGNFRIISSVIGKGAFCVFEGKFDGETGSIEVQVHKAFRILILIWSLLPILAIITSIYIDGFFYSIGIIIIFVIILLVIRFVLIELLFKSVSKSGLEKLKNIMGIIEIKECKE